MFVDYVQTLHRPALPRDAARAGRRLGARQVRDRRGPRHRDGRGRVEAGAGRLRDRTPACSPTARSATATARAAWASGTSTSTASSRPSRSTGRTTQRTVEVDCSRGSTSAQEQNEGGGVIRRGVPVGAVGDTTGHDRLRPACSPSTASAVTACPASGPRGYDDPRALHAGVAGGDHRRPRRAGDPDRHASSRQNAEDSGGRSMILMGAGTNHWFHSDTIYRTFLALVTLTGCQGINGGGWAHYVGQEKCRPVTGWAQLAFGLDWQRPPRQMIGTAFWYVQTDQWRYDGLPADTLASPLGSGRWGGMATIDTLAQSARSGWMPSLPLARPQLPRPRRRGQGGRPRPRRLRRGQAPGPVTSRSRSTTRTPRRTGPRVLTVWRANLLGSSSKGNEYFLRHLLGTDNAVRAEEVGRTTGRATWRGERPRTKASSTCWCRSTSG